MIVLRAKRPEVERPFRVPLYPVLPLAFAGSCGFVLWSSLAYARLGSPFGVAVLVAGGLVILIMTRARQAKV